MSEDRLAKAKALLARLIAFESVSDRSNLPLIAFVEDYLAALDRLSKMPTPHWRRPNAVGNRNLVSVVSWQRKTLAEMGLKTDDDEDA